jgi:uncharacterized SAM-binding protein YcdF (DUF218 family)
MIRRLSGAAFRLFLILAAVIVPLSIGFVRFADSLPKPIDDPTITDAIVVLTGGSDRISTGIALLEAGKAQRLFVSGVNNRVDITALLKVSRTTGAPPPADLASRIDLGHTAGDTFGNAEETADWMHEHQYKTMRLVTADYHMRRALIEFRMAAPDIEILPNPVHPAVGGDAAWWQNQQTLGLLAGEYGKYLIVRWRYLISRMTSA